MFLPPPTSTKTHWVYDDPSGLPEPAPAAYAAAVRPGKTKIVSLPVRRPVPATPKAA